MSETTAIEKPGSIAPETASSTMLRLVRRVHMFTGLFLGPWMLIYALSTLVMTHREYVGSFYSTKNPQLVLERELEYSRSFPTNATREEIAGQILRDVGLDGTHSVSGGRNGKPLVVTRNHARTPRRITLDAARNKLTIQREEFRATNCLERMHRRRGYNSYWLENCWGFTVDAAVVAMSFWSLSGVWMWWGLKPTRVFGALALGAGLATFAVFLWLI
jgi:hypothetical protein